MEEKNKTAAGWVFGGLSFIPLFGFFFGIVAIIIGIVKKTKGPIILGAIGMLIWVTLYGGLFYFSFFAKTGTFADLKVQLLGQLFSTDAGQIALYKNQHGTLPATLADLGPVTTQNVVWLTDPWDTNISYQPHADGTFELRSAGPDKTLNTNDDIVKEY